MSLSRFASMVSTVEDVFAPPPQATFRTIIIGSQQFRYRSRSMLNSERSH